MTIASHMPLTATHISHMPATKMKTADISATGMKNIQPPAMSSRMPVARVQPHLGKPEAAMAKPTLKHPAMRRQMAKA